MGGGYKIFEMFLTQSLLCCLSQRDKKTPDGIRLYFNADSAFSNKSYIGHYCEGNIWKVETPRLDRLFLVVFHPMYVSSNGIVHLIPTSKSEYYEYGNKF